MSNNSTKTSDQRKAQALKGMLKKGLPQQLPKAGIKHNAKPSDTFPLQNDRIQYVGEFFLYNGDDSNAWLNSAIARKYIVDNDGTERAETFMLVNPEMASYMLKCCNKWLKAQTHLHDINTKVLTK